MTNEAEMPKRPPYIESGAGEPLLLLHGGTSDRHQYDLFRPLFGDGIRAIAYDQRDTRDNPSVGDEYAIRDLAGDCVDFLDALNIEKCHIFGASYGGTIAMSLAIHYPTRVQSLVLAGTTPSFAMGDPKKVARVTSESDPAAIQRFMLQQAITPEAIEHDAKLVDETLSVIRPASPERVARRMKAASTFDAREDLGKIRAPTLVMHGDDDPVISLDTAVWMAAQIPGAEFTVLNGSRHGITIQHRERTANLVRQFVMKHPLIK